VNGHLFGAGDPGAALARKQRREDAARRNAAQARQDTEAKTDKQGKGR